MKSVVRPELSTAAAGPSQAPAAAVDNSAPRSTHPEPTYKSGKTVQITGTTSGLRELSRELLERELGPRSEQEYLRARERGIEREQWTEIDRALERRAGLERVVSYEDFEPFTEGAQVRAEQEMERLAYLEKLGLAPPDRGTQLGALPRSTSRNCAAASASTTSSRAARANVSRSGIEAMEREMER